MSGYTLSPRAIRDLEEIWDFTASTWSIDQAERYIRQIESTIAEIAAKPSIARPCDAIRTGYFKHPVGSHVLFFRMVPAGIGIVRILHGRMDFDRHLHG